MKKSQDILLLTDTRISQQKYEFIIERSSLSDQINTKKKGFTPQNLRMQKLAEQVYTFLNVMTML